MRLGGVAIGVVAVAAVLGAVPVAAQTPREAALARVFPAAEAFGAVAGKPPAAPAYRQGRVVGWVFFTADVIDSVGFSGRRLDIAVGLGRDGRITGAEIVEHHEPILVIGVSDADLRAFVAQFRGVDVRETLTFDKVEEGARRIDAVSGATVSSLAMKDAILRAARAVARSRGVLSGAATAIDVDRFAPADWPSLAAEGAIARLALHNRDVDAALAEAGAAPYGPPGVPRDPDGLFVELYAALATPAMIGRNLLGRRLYERLMAARRPGEQLIFVAGRGLYSFRGTAWRRTGVFDRIEIVQGEKTLTLRKAYHQLVQRVAAGGAPALRDIAVFVLPSETGFDPAAPWRLDLSVGGETEAGPVYVRFTLPYRLPSSLVRKATTEADAEPLWVHVWWEHAGRVAVLGAALLALTLILIVEDAIARRRRLYPWVRYGFLAFTLVWMGWYAGAQLSVVNVFTFAQTLLTGFRWDIFLVAPLIFLLWSFVALTLLFWGRGVYCGWLCPFGALQELLNRGAKALGVPQITVPFVIHERLWMIKYVVFIGLFALAIGGYEVVQPLSEVEPFKTAIVLHFHREWPFIAFALSVLAVGLVHERAYCRYLCPLGGALEIPARLHMFHWLKRKWQCGTQCQICAQRCTVQAIHPDGHINPNECIHCLNCQVLYYDDTTCPPLIERRKRRERARRSLEMAP